MTAPSSSSSPSPSFAPLSALSSLMANPRVRAVLPMLLDMAAPVIAFFALSVLFGIGPVMSLSVGAAAAGARTAYRCIKARRLTAFPLMIMVTLVGSLVLVFVTGDARLILAKSAVIPALGGTFGIITTFVGRTLINDVVTPFITKGDERLAAAWDDCWQNDPAFVARFRLLNLIWGIGFLTAAVLRVVIIYNVPLNVAVLAGQVPTLLGLLILIAITRFLGRPLFEALRARQAPAVATAVPVGGAA